MHLKILLWAIGLCSLAVSKSLKETLSSTPDLSILSSLLDQFDLLDQFNAASNITLLAPTDQAYLDLAKWGFNVSEVPPFIARALLTYHVLDGEYDSAALKASSSPNVVHTLLQPPVLTNVSEGAAVKLSRSGETMMVESGLQVLSGVEEANVAFSNGIIHKINSSLVLPHNISTTAAVGGLTAFLGAMDDASVVTELESQADVTLFIPRNSALQKLQPLLSMLSAPQLAKVLRYHAVPGKVLYGDDLLGAEAASLPTLEGSTLDVRAEGGQVLINNAKVVRSDLILYGGVVHIIDDVLVPAASETGSPRTDSGPMPALAKAQLVLQQRQ